MKIFLLILIAVAVIGGGYFLIHKTQQSASIALSSPTDTPSENTSMPTPTPASLPDKVNVTMVTSRGNIELELYPKVAPMTVANFIDLATGKKSWTDPVTGEVKENTPFYDGTKFHRVVPDFVIQGGDPFSRTNDPRVGTGGPGYAFKDEINPKSIGVSDADIKALETQGYQYDSSLQSLPVTVGALAMANAGPNTNGSQFFIVSTQDQLNLNGRHTVFGKVIKGMDVVQKIKQGDLLKQVIVKL